MKRRHAAEVPRITSRFKAALALLYHVLGSPNPFAQCQAPKFAPEKTELRYHTSSQLGQLLRELREDKGSYFGHLTFHLASALFFTGCRYHEWALLTMDRLVREPSGVIIAVRLQVKGGSFRDLPLTPELSDSLEGWFAFLESVKGVRLRRGWGSQLRGIGVRLSWQERRSSTRWLTLPSSFC